jgi:hypothetical protein
MPTCVARGPELEIEIPSKIQVAIPSQYPRGMTVFTVHWSKDGGSDETHRINSVVAVAKARRLEASGYRVRITDRRAANSCHANSTNYSAKPPASLSARDFSPA